MEDTIKVTSHVARDFLQNSAYFSTVPKVVWEYVSNSVDNPKSGQPTEVDVRISKDRLVIEDIGSGMSRRDLYRFFQMHAENIRRIRGESVRGRYGTGKCAAFGIANILRIETIQNGLLNIVELIRDDIENAKTGEPFPVKNITTNKNTSDEDGTKVIISAINIKNLQIPETIAYVERHLGRRLQTESVVINGHLCEFHESYSSWSRVFKPDDKQTGIFGQVELNVKVSPIPLEKEKCGIDILSKGNWYDTYGGNLEGEAARRIFGEIDVPILEDSYETEKIPPFDNTRNMILNIQNPIVASLLGWISSCLDSVAQEISQSEKARKQTEEAKKLSRHARDIEEVLNNDFRNLQLELEKIRRKSKTLDKELVDSLIPGAGDLETGYQLGGAEHGEGSAGDSVGPGEVPRLGPSLISGKEKGHLGKVTERKHQQSTFHVEYKHEEEQSPRSHYDNDTRTIFINLDHPQISRVFKDTGIDNKQFKEFSYEVAFVEYAIALGYEKVKLYGFYDGVDALFDIGATINRVSRFIVT